MRLRILIITLSLFIAMGSSLDANARLIDAKFMERNEVALAQFWYSHPNLSKIDFAGMEVMLATDLTQATGSSRSPIQFYVLYVDSETGKDLPRYYFFVDPKMRQSKVLFNADPTGQDAIAPIELLPPHLLDSETNDKTGMPDVLSYFGQIEPGEFGISHFMTNNGYEISLRDGPRHDPDTVPELILLDPEGIWIRNINGQLQDYIGISGTLKAVDVWDPMKRAQYVNAQHRVRANRDADPRFQAALDKILRRMERYGNRELASDPSASQRSAILSGYVPNLKTTIESQVALERCQDIF